MARCVLEEVVRDSFEISATAKSPCDQRGSSTVPDPHQSAAAPRRGVLWPQSFGGRTVAT